MKNNHLLPLLLVLIANSVFAQKQLPRAVRPYAADWTWTLVKSMHRAGFDMPTMPHSETRGVQSRSPLRLDSTKTFYAYSLSPASDSVPFFRTTYTYLQTDTKIETDYQHTGADWLALSRTTLKADALGRLVLAEAEAYDPDAQTYHPDSKLEIYPHGDSPELIDSFFTWLWDSTALDWRIILSVRNTFDAQDRLVENLSSVDYFGDPAIFKEVYSYDDNGDNHLIEEFAILGDDVFPSARTEIDYVDHKPIEVLYSEFDGTEFYPKDRINYAYSLFGAVRLQMNFQWDIVSQTFKMNQRIEYGFDNAQRVASKINKIIEANGAEALDLTTYAYVEGDDLYLEMYLLWDDDAFDWKLDGKKYYYYDNALSADAPQGEALALAVWPNPATGLVRLSLPETGAVQVFDAAGRMVLARDLQTDQALDITALPAGLYVLTAQSEGAFYRGKMLKQ
jgi:hypothetical protein